MTDIPRQRAPIESMTILATRGERTIRWKCVDLRELLERTSQFEGQGYVVTR